ncbi:hypothetical protein Smp_084330 [Schistosoma mansoni]|uniref:hypothetical protein n=1 Tax=Schistosoma mansoni TaxID=6183 RepID=UPI00022C853D|nr:hypothetical protein Smp_084330 [Schistosoma mansoni]|eukprot:XP_018644344.1 hypothetical protein Smp_084330 [Schistosoma mansoni]
MKAINRGRKNRELQREAEILEKELSKYEQGHDAYEILLMDYHILEERLQEARRDIDAEKLLRTDLENKFLILQERLCVKSRLLDECEGLAKHGFEIKNSADGWKQGGYKGQVIEKFKSIRDQSVLQSEEYKIPRGTFENKRKRLRSSANVDGEHDSDQGSKLVVACERVIEVSQRRVKYFATSLAKKRYKVIVVSDISKRGKWPLGVVESYNNNDNNLFSNNRLLHEACRFTGKIKLLRNLQSSLLKITQLG